MHATNLAGAENVLGAAVDAGCDPVVHVSTVAALFPFQTDPVTAEHPVVGAETAMARPKRHANGTPARCRTPATRS